jgi:hypothetical protein
MRRILVTSITALGIGLGAAFLGGSPVMAAPIDGIVIGNTTDVAALTEQVHWYGYWRHHHRHHRYYYRHWW